MNLLASRPAVASRRALLFRIARLCLLGALGGSAFYFGLRSGAPTEPPFPARSLIVAALNVGHGEASWIKTPGGEFAVIGTGPPEAAPALIRSLRGAGARRISLLVLPYPYADGLGAAPELIDAFPVDRVLETGWVRVNRRQEETRVRLKARKIVPLVGRAGQTLPLSTGTLEVLAPGETLVPRSPAAGNNSLVVRFRWGKTAFLWAGGIEGPGEEALLARGADRLRADWLRVARFGNPTATSAELLRAVAPRFAIVSTGANSGGLPAPAVLDRLRATGAEVLRTDVERADLIFASDGERIARVR